MKIFLYIKVEYTNIYNTLSIIIINNKKNITKNNTIDLSNSTTISKTPSSFSLPAFFCI